MASILMFPFLAYGHASPFLELAKRLSANNFHIYFCSTTVLLDSIRKTLEPKFSSSIHLIDINLPSTILPPHYHSTKDLPPRHLGLLMTALDSAKPALAQILDTLKPTIVIYDIYQPRAAEAARQRNIPAVLFYIVSAVTIAYFGYCRRGGCDLKCPIPEKYLPDNRVLQSFDDIANSMTIGDRFMKSDQESCDLVLCRTSVEVESKYIDYRNSITTAPKKELVPTGLLFPNPIYKEDDGRAVMEWLSKKESSSVVYLSVGSNYFLSKEEIDEIAHGLELSKVDFIWVIRFHGENKSTIDEALPEGFLERTKEKGLVVEGWAPQVKILGHKSIGGFVSHVGWSSAIEGMVFGVPIISIPMETDQPLNSIVVSEMGVGMKVPKENGLFKGVDLARVIRHVMVEGEGKLIRKKAKELGQKIKEKGDDHEIHLVAQKLMRLAPSSAKVAP